MSVLQYFIPGSTAATIAREDGTLDRHQLDGLGMLTALRDLRQVPRDATVVGLKGGPGGQDGVLLIPTTKGGEKPRIGYFEDSQLWQDMGKYWIGMNNGDVSSEDLRRRRLYTGYNVSADDGVQWLIPIARGSESGNGVTLPRDVLFRGGKPTLKLQAAYMELWEFATAIAEWCNGEASPASEIEWRATAALNAMSVNHRIWKDEIDFLSEVGQPILTTDVIDTICLSLADIQFFQEAKKNDSTVSGPTQSDSSSSISGIEDGERVTSQAGASC